MKKLIVASMRKSAGKTSVIVGIAKALGKKMGYLKPFGDRLLYRKKLLWDYDAALITTIFDLEEKPEEMSIGFDPSKLRYMYDEEGTKGKLLGLVSYVGSGKEVLFVEGGKDMGCGISVHLDPISVARYTDSRLVVVISGNDDTILDDIIFFKRYLELSEIDFGGVILNKVHDVEDFKEVHFSKIRDMGIKVLGIIPYREELTHFSVEYLAERLFAKVITGEGGLKNRVKQIFIGAMSTSSVFSYPPFREKDKIVITGGDRSDMILAALETKAAGIVLTGNILPPQNIISKTSEQNVPLLLVTTDTYQTTRQIDMLEPLLLSDDAEKIALCTRLVQAHVSVDEVVET